MLSASFPQPEHPAIVMTTDEEEDIGGGGGFFFRRRRKKKRKLRKRSRRKMMEVEVLVAGGTSSCKTSASEAAEDSLVADTSVRLSAMSCDDEDDDFVDNGQTGAGGEGDNNRLFKILDSSDNEANVTTTSGVSSISDSSNVVTTTTEESQSIASSLFQRGSHLVSSVRSSLRKMASPWLNKAGGGEGAARNNPEAASSNCSEACNSSQDSGLGEDSDSFDPGLRGSSLISSAASPRSPTPGAAAPGIIRPSNSSLRKTSSASSSSNIGVPVKKHVVIREPSLTNLPSSRYISVINLPHSKISQCLNVLFQATQEAEQLRQGDCEDLLHDEPDLFFFGPSSSPRRQRDLSMGGLVPEGPV